jgi:hypothetical protein
MFKFRGIARILHVRRHNSNIHCDKNVTFKIEIEKEFSEEKNSRFYQHFEKHLMMYQSLGVIVSLHLASFSLMYTVKNDMQQRQEMCDISEKQRYEHLKEEKILFIMRTLENIDILKMKRIYKELLGDDGSNRHVDLSEIVEWETKTGERKRMRRIDAVMTSTSYRVDKPEERAINAQILHQITLMQYSLTLIKSLDVPEHDPKFYYARVALGYLGYYIES